MPQRVCEKQPSLDKYDTFLEAATGNTFVQLKGLWNDQQQLQAEQSQLLQEHKGLLQRLKQLQKQQEHHIAREVSKDGVVEEKQGNCCCFVLGC